MRKTGLFLLMVLLVSPSFVNGLTRHHLRKVKGQAEFKGKGAGAGEADSGKIGDQEIGKIQTPEELENALATQTLNLSEADFAKDVTEVANLIEEKKYFFSTKDTVKNASDFFDKAYSIAGKEYDATKWEAMHKLVRAGFAIDLYKLIKDRATLDKERRFRVQWMNIIFGALDENFGTYSATDNHYRDMSCSGAEKCKHFGMTFPDENYRVPVCTQYVPTLASTAYNLEKHKSSTSYLRNYLKERNSLMNKWAPDKGTCPIAEAAKLQGEFYWAITEVGIKDGYDNTLDTTLDGLRKSEKMLQASGGNELLRAGHVKMLEACKENRKSPSGIGKPLEQTLSGSKQLELRQMYSRYGVE